MAAHSTLGASSAERWMACPGSVAATSGLPDTSSAFAHEGTCAHYLGERCLTEGVTPDNYLNEVITLPEGDRSEGMPDEFTVSKEMVKNVAVYVDFCNALGGEMFIEQRLDYSRWVEGGFGTGDCLNFDEETGTLDVTDLKYGQGIKVYSEDLDGSKNKQLMLYGLGAYDLLEMLGFAVLRVRLNVVQPRLDHIATSEVDMKELLTFGKEASEKSKLTFLPDAPFHAGPKQCQWCKLLHKGCEEADRYTKEVALQGFDFLSENSEDLDPAAHVEQVPASRLEKILQNESLVKAVLTKARARAEEMLFAGEAVKGLKVVKGRASKKYSEDEDEIVRRLKSIKHLSAKEVVVVKPISPAVAFKHKGISERWKKANINLIDGKNVVAHESDSREAVNVSATALDGFDLDE